MEFMIRDWFDAGRQTAKDCACGNYICGLAVVTANPLDFISAEAQGTLCAACCNCKKCKFRDFLSFRENKAIHNRLTLDKLT